MPQIENKVSVGNLVSMAATLLTMFVTISGLVWWGARIDQRMVFLEQQVQQHSVAIVVNKDDIQSLEQAMVRFDEKLSAILRRVDEVKAAIADKQ